MADSKPLTIGALSRATRIPIATLRTWERRYRSPMPIRKPSGHRVYSAQAVEHLRRVVRLRARGHRPADILGLSVGELDTLLRLSETAEASRGAESGEPGGLEEVVDRSLPRMREAAHALDREVLVRELRANWARLGPLRFLEACAGPFLTEIGRAWSTGALEIRHEHFAMGCVADLLREVREPYDREAKGPRVVVATLPGEAHEGGLLMASLLLAMRDYRVIYLGLSTPIEQIAATVRVGGAEAVAVSVSLAAKKARVAPAVARLRRLLPRPVPLWIGGAGAPEAPRGVERFTTLAALDERVAAWR